MPDFVVDWRNAGMILRLKWPGHGRRAESKKWSDGVQVQTTESTLGLAYCPRPEPQARPTVVDIPGRPICRRRCSPLPLPAPRFFSLSRHGSPLERSIGKKWHWKNENGEIQKTIPNGQKIDMAHAGLEPATFALLARRSNQLS
jgi:hypothetical protein